MHIEVYLLAKVETKGGPGAAQPIFCPQ
jgi:hypothetical protein